jgi:NAD(P)-dependent dehydrogenase (short-subunit alcohol dehydrogenase family)
MRGLRDKVIVVAAGGTSVDRPGLRASIGGATARRLADEGARVVVGDLVEEAAQETARLIESAGGKAVAQQYDASDEASIRALMTRAIEEFGGIDGVHVNAMDMSGRTLGVDGQHDLLTLPLEVWRRTIDVGLTGLLLTARHAIPHLLERGGGGIVVTTSVTVYKGEPTRLAYATVKTGMTAIVRHIASRWGREGVRANAVAPGRVVGPAALAAMSDEEKDDVLRIGRSHLIGRGDDIAAMVSFLLSDDGAWLNGQIVSVDGGVAMRA